MHKRRPPARAETEAVVQVPASGPLPQRSARRRCRLPPLPTRQWVDRDRRRDRELRHDVRWHGIKHRSTQGPDPRSSWICPTGDILVGLLAYMTAPICAGVSVEVGSHTNTANLCGGSPNPFWTSNSHALFSREPLDADRHGRRQRRPRARRARRSGPPACNALGGELLDLVAARTDYQALRPGRPAIAAPDC